MNSIKKKQKKKNREERLKQRAMTAWAIQKEGGGVNQSGLYVLCIRLNPCDLKVHCRSEEKAFWASGYFMPEKTE